MTLEEAAERALEVLEGEWENTPHQEYFKTTAAALLRWALEKQKEKNLTESHHVNIT